MSFDLSRLAELSGKHGPVVRVVVAEVAGSAPREVGTAMVVWADGQDGTIGGGALEYKAAARARAMLAGGPAVRLDRQPLGPSLGQCCGGAVTLMSEVWDAAALAGLDGRPVVARALPGKGAEMPLAVHRLLAKARGQGAPVATRIVQGWLIEPVAKAGREVWIWGAGHVGRALVSVLLPVPGLRITWVDVAADRFPVVPDRVVQMGVVQMIAPNPADLVAKAPRGAEHLVLTFSHALDLELCHRLLGHGFAALGLIGSATKWARFRSRLAALGHGAEAVARITCPIGDPALGKHPQAIAVGVAAELLRRAGVKSGNNGAGRDETQGERAG